MKNQSEMEADGPPLSLDPISLHHHLSDCMSQGLLIRFTAQKKHKSKGKNKWQGTSMLKDLYLIQGGN